MPQPAEVERAAKELIALYEQAQADIEADLQALANAPTAAKRRARLRAAAAGIDRRVAELETASAGWVSARLPEVYALGGTAASERMGEVWAWTSGHNAAVQQLAETAWADLLRATTYVREETKVWLRDQLRRQAGLSITEGRTAQQAAKAIVSAAGEAVEAVGGPAGFVRYRDGSYRALADHVDSAVRTITGNAYNAGNLNQYGALGVSHVVGLDGNDCHLYSHNDGPRVNGNVFPLSVAQMHPLGHPRCRRSWSAAPQGVKSAAEARASGVLPSEAQMADQAAAEVRREETLTRRRVNRQAREPRSPRAPRSPRTARAG